jgi:hypothetical protein
MELPYVEVGIVAVLLVNYLVVELYKLVFPAKPLNPRTVNAIVAPVVGAVVAAVARGEPWQRVVLAGVAALGAFLSASGIHYVHDTVRDD